MTKDDPSPPNPTAAAIGDVGSQTSRHPGGRSASLTAGSDDDIVIAFQTVQSSARGRIVRLGASVDAVLSSHAYPLSVSRVLGEAVALTAMLGSQLKFDGKLILQTNTNGPLRVLVVNYQTAGSFRGYASFDKEAVAALEVSGPDNVAHGALIGTGYMAITIDQGADMERYQGIVQIAGNSLSEAAQEYFRASEQIASFIKLTVARLFSGGVWRWRAGGLMVQHLTAEGGNSEPGRDADGSDAEIELEYAEEHWRRVETLARTVEDHELTDPTLAPQQLLYRLFHEEGVRAAPPQQVEANCGCTRDHVGGFLARFKPDELSDLRDPDGAMTITCEFCATAYRFTDGDL